MSIVPLQRVTVYGMRSDKSVALAALQELGCMHIVPLSEREVELETSQDLRLRYRKALAFLQSSPQKRRSVGQKADFDPAQIEEEVTAVRRRARELFDEKDNLEEKIAAIQPWGDFEFASRDELGGYRLWFYEVPHYLMRRVEKTDLVWHVVRRSARSTYLVVVSKDEPKGIPARRTRTGNRSLTELVTRMDDVETEIEHLKMRRYQLTRWTSLLERYIAEVEDRAEHLKAEAVTFDAPHAFALSGWAPVERINEIAELCDGLGLAYVVEEPDENDSPPTLLRNPAMLASGADLVRVYRTPPYNSWDPSIIIYLSFVVFFAMILSDAGYGALMAMLTLLFWWRMGRSEGGRLFRPLMVSLSAATIGYGALVGSYFGVTPPADSILGRLHIIQIDDFGSMIHLSVIVGVVHIIMANVISAWQVRHSTTALRPVGWVVAILGGTMLYEQNVFATAPAWLTTVGYSMIGAGITLIILFASARPLRPSPIKALLLRFLDGLLAATEVSKAFGDVLSYLRLFALGLSSAFLAITFNEMAQGLVDSYQNIGIVGAFFILLLGHVLNFALCLMAGVVHGLRLNYIEFFNWSLTEDGYPFRPFLRKAG